MMQICSAQITEPINILVTIDKNYIPPLSVMLNSYGDVHKDTETHLYIAYSSLTEDDICFLRQVAEHNGIILHDIRIKEQWFAGTPVLERLPEESFYRLLAFRYLPQEVHRCLYLDPDIIIRHSILSLYYMEMGDHYIAAASHTYGAKNKLNLLRLGLFENKRYINSGIMLMNLDAIRRDFTLESILKSLNENIQKLFMGDQDLINILFGRNVLLIDERIYNLDERTFRHYKDSFHLQDVEKQTAIIHYNGKFKPWLNGYKGELECFYPQVADKGPAPKGKWKAQFQALYQIMCPDLNQKIMIGSFFGVLMLCACLWFSFGKELIKIIAEPQLFRSWLDQFGLFDELAFILIRAVQTVVKIIPSEPLEIASGYAWGAIPGMLYCIIGNMIGSLVILALVRRFGKKFVQHLLPEKTMHMLGAFQDSQKTYTLLFILYLIPGSPKDGFTYLVGLLPIRTVPFMLLSFIARIPSVLSSTICGASLAGKQYFLSVVVFVVTAILAVGFGFLYNKYMKKLSIQNQKQIGHI